MENKINIAELLKYCPKGMELDCTICNGVKFIELDRNPNFPIVVRANNGYEFTLTKYGQVHNIDDAKCVIFPKGKTTWDGFIPPCRFKDGDVLFVDCGEEEEDNSYQYIFILNDPKNYGKWHSYCHLDGVGNLHLQRTYLTDDEYHPRFATEEEKQKLFDAIKANGYKWNAETKTLEKLPKFKVGDRIRHKEKTSWACVIERVDDRYWVDKHPMCYTLLFDKQDEYELVPNKFDITTLKPFDKVLYRMRNNDTWCAGFFNFYKNNNCFVIGNAIAHQCIPYEENKHLLGTTNDCDEFYKTWEK